MSDEPWALRLANGGSDHETTLCFQKSADARPRAGDLLQHPSTKEVIKVRAVEDLHDRWECWVIRDWSGEATHGEPVWSGDALYVIGNVQTAVAS